MNTARFVLEIYRYFVNFLPSRLRFRLKRYIDTSRQEWQEIGVLQSRLSQTPYQLLLDIKHWHQRWTYVKGYYPEPHITQVLDEYLNEGNLYIDIGANIGVHTVYCAHKVGQSGQCIAIEPNPHSFKRLEEQIVLNNLNNVVVHHTALGNDTGTVTLHGCNDENVGSTIRSDTDNTNNDCVVALNRADELLQNIPANQSGICKIDVEGYEIQVLLGMTNFLQSHPQMIYIVEVTDDWLQATGGSAQILFDIFKEYGYLAHLIEPETGKMKAISEPLPDRQYDTLFKMS